MSYLYNLKRKVQRRMPRQWQSLFQEMIYEVLYRASPARRQNFFNSGYSPASSEFRELQPFCDEPLQATLCDIVISRFPDSISGSRDRILEIGCGLGGGLRVASLRFPESSIVGIDVNAAAVRASRKRLSHNTHVTIQHANGRALPFDHETFDFVYSIGSASYIGLNEFFAEAARVLKPGGVLSFSAGYTNARLSDHQRWTNNFASKSGLVVHEVIDITENVFRAIAEDVDRRQDLINQLPGPLRGYAANWADMPGTLRYREYEQGRRLDYVVICSKPQEQ